jgi:hypothetical protein
MIESTDPIQATQHWLREMVVGLNLCPFAAPLLDTDSLLIERCDEPQLEQQLAAILLQLDKIQLAEESAIATSLLVFSQGLNAFDEFWGLVELADELLQQVGLEGEIQIASFHPAYCFEGVAEDDASNYSNRSPYPTLHFIREAQLTKALANYPNPEKIPENNIRRLQQLGVEALLQRMTPADN